MKGLLKNNYFAVRSNAKAFSVFMLLLGIFVVAVISMSNYPYPHQIYR